MSIVLLTQSEAAKMVRCSTAKIARERYLGRLAYLPGRPVLIRLDDVLDWLDRRRVGAADTSKENYNAVRAARRAVLRKRHGRTPNN